MMINDINSTHCLVAPGAGSAAMMVFEVKMTDSAAISPATIDTVSNSAVILIDHDNCSGGEGGNNSTASK